MAAPATVNGVWFGRAGLADDQLAIRVDLREKSGALRGVLYMGDSGVGELLDSGAVEGTRTGGSASFTAGTRVRVVGTFEADAFAGTLSLTRPGGQIVAAPLTLGRVPAPRRGYVPITPTRLIDTREERGFPPAEGETVSVAVTGRGNIPFTGVGAVVVNITGTEALGRGFVTAYASRAARPFTSNVYLERAGQTAGNLAIVPVGDDGFISIFTLSGTHLVVDAFGWFPADSVLRRVEPMRALDTRPDSAVGYSGPKPAAGSVVTASIAGVSGVPGSGVGAVVVNITATEATAPGFISAWASGQPRPQAANLNVEYADQTIGNLAIVPVNQASAMDLFTQSGTHLIVDVLGWFAVEPDTGPVGNAPSTGTIARDGSFEASPSIPATPSFRSLTNGATVGAWMIVEGGVDLVGPTSAAAADGDQFIDLNGNAGGPGVIEQLVPTTAGRRYAVSFRLAGNPNGGPTVKHVEVGFGDQLRRYSFDITGHTNAALGWVEHRFVANPDCGSSTALSFRSLTIGDRGPNLDAVSVVDDGPSDSCRRGGYHAAGPVRLLDTRPDSPVAHSGPKPGAHGEVRVKIAGREGVPAVGLSAVVVNLTATEADAPGFVTAWASGGPRPFTSSLNLDAAGQTRPNHAIVPVGADGAISLYTLNGAHLIVDLFGYFTG